MYPSIKTLRIIAADRAKELRRVLETTKRDDIEAILDTEWEHNPGAYKYPHTRTWYYQCYNPLDITTAKLSIASEIMSGFGIEYIPQGHNAKSPAIDYVNMGDTYTATLLRVNGSYRVGCWGDIVERGSYD